MSVRCLSKTEITAELAVLRSLLSGLPPSLPEGGYAFDGLELDPEEASDFGRGGALNAQLERALAPRGRADGLTLCGRGAGLVAVVDVLHTFISEFPMDVVLQKWVFDLQTAARNAGAVCTYSPRIDFAVLIAYRAGRSNIEPDHSEHHSRSARSGKRAPGGSWSATKAVKGCKTTSANN